MSTILADRTVAELSNEFGLSATEVRAQESIIRDAVAAGAAYVLSAIERYADSRLWMDETALALLAEARSAARKVTP